MNAQDTVKLIAAGLKLGIKAYENALRLSEAGYAVPNLADFENRICQLRCVPHVPGSPDGQNGHGGKGGKLETGTCYTAGGNKSGKLRGDLEAEMSCSPFSVEGHA